MKTFTSMIIAGLLCWAGAVRAQTVTLNIDAGLLENTTGTAAEPVGGLVQLLASPTGTFGSPATSSFAGGDDVIVASFAMNYNSKTTGEISTALTSISLSGAGISTNEDLILRWFPSVTYSASTNYATTGPALLTAYGQARSDTVEFSSTVDPSETAWVVPAAGSTVDLDYITADDGGSYSNNSGFATDFVTGVPEPSIWALAGGTFCGISCLFAFGARNLRAWKSRGDGLSAALARCKRFIDVVPSRSFQGSLTQNACLPGETW